MDWFFHRGSVEFYFIVNEAKVKGSIYLLTLLCFQVLLFLNYGVKSKIYRMQCVLKIVKNYLLDFQITICEKGVQKLDSDPDPVGHWKFLEKCF